MTPTIQREITTSPKRLAIAIVRLLDASEAAMTRGSSAFARTYAAKAAEASASLHNLSMDALEDLAPRRRSKTESLHGRFM